MANGQELLISESLAVSAGNDYFLLINCVFWRLLGLIILCQLFVFKEITPTQIRKIGADNAHLKFQMNQEGAQLDAIAFSNGASSG